jgi:dolichol-phosphate mannosyltransferase
LRIQITIPTYNEAENLPAIAEALLGLNIEGLHLLVVDDHSPDGTGEIAEGLKSSYTGRVEVIHRTGKLGLGSAYIAGFKHGLKQGFDLIGQMDADFSHPPEVLFKFMKAIENGADLAIGSRYIPGGRLDDEWPIWRKFLSGFGNYYARTILQIPIKDVTGGFRLWKNSLLNKMPLEDIRSNGYVFQVEMAYVALKMGCRYKEIPFYFADRKFGKSKMSVKIQLEAAINVWRLLKIH